jgi:hypothetical protein
MSETPRIEVTVAAPIETVWSVLRDPELIARWHGWEDDGLAEEIRIIYLNGATADPGSYTLVLSDGDRFTLHEVPAGVLVRITRAPRNPESEWAMYYDDINEGWWTFLQQLRFAAERHGMAERRTLYLEGRPTEPQPVAAVAGLGAEAALPAGTAYTATAPTGDPLAGTVWARAERQLVLTVDGWGDGLLVLAEQPVTAHRPHGGAMVLLTTYGQDAATFAELTARWTAWWDKHVERTDPLP